MFMSMFIDHVYAHIRVLSHPLYMPMFMFMSMFMDYLEKICCQFQPQLNSTQSTELGTTQLKLVLEILSVYFEGRQHSHLIKF